MKVLLKRSPNKVMRVQFKVQLKAKPYARSKERSEPNTPPHHTPALPQRSAWTNRPKRSVTCKRIAILFPKNSQEAAEHVQEIELMYKSHICGLQFHDEIRIEKRAYPLRYIFEPLEATTKQTRAPSGHIMPALSLSPAPPHSRDRGGANSHKPCLEYSRCQKLAHHRWLHQK